MKEEGSPGEVHRKSEREGRGESERRRGKDGWRKVLYGEYGAAVRRVFIAAAICRPIVITALSNPSYDCMCHAGSMLRPRHRASLRTRIHHFFATAKRVDPFLLQRDPCMDANRVYIYIYCVLPVFRGPTERELQRERRRASRNRRLTRRD